MKITYDFPADTSILSRVGEIIGGESKKAGFSEKEVWEIQFSIDEACTNTIVHGLNQDASLIFKLIIEWKEGEIEITIHETGIPFDPGKIKTPDLEADLADRKVGGLGMFIVQQLMDEVEYKMDEKGVKTLRMLKRKS